MDVGSKEVAMVHSKEQIRELNDNFRLTLRGGKVMIRAGVQSLPIDITAAALQRMRAFRDFTPDNDLHGENDFGSIEERGYKFFWKIDYYDKELEYGSEDPSIPEVTTRVLT